SLRESIKGSSSTFACGGSVAIENVAYGGTPQLRGRSHPVNVFWESDSTVQKLVLPINQKNKSAVKHLQSLAGDCIPATFGRGDQDVLDPTYRRAGKLEPAHFSSNFHPADFGIIDQIEQDLLPTINDGPGSSGYRRKIIPELYKLNVYTGPSGFFHKHVDTPRGPKQIGSLVVCLPSEFKGGVLHVRNGGQDLSYDWSHASGSAIQWAAFYSDCEHEIKAVTEGERITLTYNLYATEIGTEGIPSALSLAPQSQHLYSALVKSLKEPSFMTEGGIVGLFCSHAYPHMSGTTAKSMKGLLKTSDYGLYSAIRSCGVDVDALPVSDTGSWYASIMKRLQRETNDTSKGKEEYTKMASDVWPSVQLNGITWLNEPNRDEIAFAHIPQLRGGPAPVAYGNDAVKPPVAFGNDAVKPMAFDKEKLSVVQYTDAAIFAVIQPWEKRSESLAL
ncbi:oxidoreductase, partial [Aspergillus steynii IBT 23096]